MLTPDTVLQGRYRIVSQLGQGGMGTVYETVDERLDTTVALKETFFAEEKLRKQFEREARLLARLHHPALPRVSDHFSEGEGQFLVMQFIPGDDLSEMLTRGKPLSRRSSFDMGRSTPGRTRLSSHPGTADCPSRYQATESQANSAWTDHSPGFWSCKGSSRRNLENYYCCEHLRLHP